MCLKLEVTTPVVDYNACMLRRIRQFFVRLLPAVALAAAWYAWWIIPEQPLRRVKLPRGCSSIQGFSADGNTMLLNGIWFIGQEPWPTCLVRVDDLRPAVPDDWFDRRSAIINPQGTRLVIGTHRDQPQDRHCRIVQLNGEYRSYQFTKPDGFVYEPDWSNDGRLLVFASDAQRGGIFIHDVEAAQLSRDGRILFATRFPDKSSIVAIDINSQQEVFEAAVLPKDAKARMLETSKDGSTLVVETEMEVSRQWNTMVLDAHSGKSKCSLLTTDVPAGDMCLSSCGRWLVRYEMSMGMRTMWDLSTSPPAQRFDHGILDSVVFTENSIFLSWNEHPHWELRRLHNFEIIKAEKLAQMPEGYRFTVASNDRLFVSCAGMRRTNLPEWFNLLGQMLGGASLSERYLIDIIDMESGAKLRTVRATSGDAVFQPSRNCIWSEWEDEVDGKAVHSLLVWPLQAPRPPWWLWGLTVVVSVWCGRKLQRIWTSSRRTPASITNTQR
jgi:WD40-like Beta Propeller Repeat